MNKKAAIIALLSLLSAFFWNELNLKSLEGKTHPKREVIRKGETVSTIDDASYLVPAKNFLESGNWIHNNGRKAYFRTPGYGIFYLSFSSFLSEKLALKFLKNIQLILFALGIYLLTLLCFNLSKKLSPTQV